MTAAAVVMAAAALTLWLVVMTWSTYRTERDRHTRSIAQLTLLQLQIDRDRRELGG